VAETIYLKCSAKEIKSKYGTKVVIGVRASDLTEFADKHKNARGYVNLVVQQRKEPGKFGDTHSVILDTYEPKARTDDPGF